MSDSYVVVDDPFNDLCSIILLPEDDGDTRWWRYDPMYGILTLLPVPSVEVNNDG